jgi:hypothetical protein
MEKGAESQFCTQIYLRKCLAISEFVLTFADEMSKNSCFWSYEIKEIEGVNEVMSAVCVWHADLGMPHYSG